MLGRVAGGEGLISNYNAYPMIAVIWAGFRKPDAPSKSVNLPLLTVYETFCRQKGHSQRSARGRHIMLPGIRPCGMAQELPGTLKVTRAPS